MRADFISGLADHADADPRVVLLTADLGWGVLDAFAERFPQRFFNVGVAEQAMVGIGTGMAAKGLHPYCYSIASFAVARAFEFLRNGPIAHALPVRLIGVGPGFEYSHDGFTHYALEDVGVLLNQPSTTVIAPRDSEAALRYGKEGSEFPGLIYYRLSKTTTPASDVPLLAPDDRITDVDVLVIGVGDATGRAKGISDSLGARGVAVLARSVEVLDAEVFDALAARIEACGARRVVVTENHYAHGGFGSRLGDELSARGWRGRLWRIGVSGFPGSDTGTLEGMTARHMKNGESVVQELIDDLRA